MSFVEEVRVSIALSLWLALGRLTRYGFYQ